MLTLNAAQIRSSLLGKTPQSVTASVIAWTLLCFASALMLVSWLTGGREREAVEDSWLEDAFQSEVTLESLDQTDVEKAAEAPIVEEALPEIAVRKVGVVLKRGSTLGGVLASERVSRVDQNRVIRALQAVEDPRSLKVGQRLELEFAPEEGGGEVLEKLTLQRTFGKSLVVQRVEDGKFQAEILSHPVERVSITKEGVIESSLYLAAERAEVPPVILNRFINLMSFDVDFQREIRKGNRFRVRYEQLRDSLNGAVDHRGPQVLSLTLNQGRRQLLYVRSQSNGEWYDGQGKALRKSLLKTPVNGARISSAFGKRKHPILGYNHLHKGVDFAAPTGTPVYAAGDGVVERSGPYGGYGNYIRIRHDGTYKTAYAHLSKIHKRARRKGQRVRQGQVIGYVGSTGRSTGPHLHYEVHVNGTPRNPLHQEFKPAEKLKGAKLVAFQEYFRSMTKDF